MIINIILCILFIIIFYLINNYINNYSIKNERYYNFSITPFPIDFVYTWKGEIYSDNIRESYNNELQYSLRSIQEYAPWYNKIYILTDPPKKLPSWIKMNNKIIMVDTSETFPDISYLPNSNSNAIETTISNIKNLSEHYIYLCDDIFIGKPIPFTIFFTFDGKAKIDKKCIFNNYILKNTNNNILNINYPLSVSKFYPHVPIPQLKSSVIKFLNTYPKYIEWIRRTNNRVGTGEELCKKYFLSNTCQQIHYPICKYMYIQKKAVFIDYNKNDIVFIMNNNMYATNGTCLLNRLLTIKPLFFCINDDEKDIIQRKKIKSDMLKFFKNYYPKKSEFEK